MSNLSRRPNYDNINRNRTLRRATHGVTHSSTGGTHMLAMDTTRWGILGCGDVCEYKSGPALYKAAGSSLVAGTALSIIL